jgi:CheY-like chemotaxis protein
VTVLVVDDVEELRRVIRLALDVQGGFQVVAEAADGASAVAAAAEHQPDIVVLDLGLPDLAGHEVLAGIRQVAAAAEIVVYTGTATGEGSEIADRVAAFVRKDRDVRYLVHLLANISRERHRAAALQLGPDVSDISVGRRFVVDSCAMWGCDAAIEEAKLVVAELATNAIIHAGGRCELRIRFAEGVLRIEVQDGTPVPPDIRAADEDAEHGRGLLIVSAVSMAWGVSSLGPRGKVVWAELAVEDADPPGLRQAEHGAPESATG